MGSPRESSRFLLCVRAYMCAGLSLSSPHIFAESVMTYRVNTFALLPSVPYPLSVSSFYLLLRARLRTYTHLYLSTFTLLPFSLSLFIFWR